jgi:hypothetical protein
MAAATLTYKELKKDIIAFMQKQTPNPVTEKTKLGAGGLGYGKAALQDETDHILAEPFFPNKPRIRITMTRCKELLANNGTVGDLVAEFAKRLGITP